MAVCVDHLFRPRFAFQFIQYFKRVPRGKGIDIERAEPLAQGIALLRLGFQSCGEQGQIAQPRRQCYHWPG